MGYIVSQKYIDPELGRINVRVTAAARRFIARWKEGILHITVPQGTTVDEYKAVLAGWKDRLLEMKGIRKAKYHEGYSFANDLLEFTIDIDPAMPRGLVRRILAPYDDSQSPFFTSFKILVHDAAMLDNDAVASDISNLVGDVARMTAPVVLEIEARRYAESLGLHHRIKEVGIGHGKRRLGTCSASGRITLTRNLVFYPEALRRSTIMHELAHLTHLDHSPAFYALWDSYLGYPHTIDDERVKAFELPII